MLGGADLSAELGAQFVKTYYVPEDFETVTASCPVPIVMAGDVVRASKNIDKVHAIVHG